jgi:hypothetical protein
LKPKERKILTLKEVLMLNRRPTLQEMVDLSNEDYTKFLYCRGVIPYIPENCDLWEFEFDTSQNYEPDEDPVLLLKDSDYQEYYHRTELLNKPLYESEEWNNVNIIEKGILYTKGRGEIEYVITQEDTILYEKDSKNRYLEPWYFKTKNWYGII